MHSNNVYDTTTNSVDTILTGKVPPPQEAQILYKQLHRLELQVELVEAYEKEGKDKTTTTSTTSTLTTTLWQASKKSR
jgi:hypothetical protein